VDGNLGIVAQALAGIANPALAASVALNSIPTPAQQMAQSLNMLRASMLVGLQSVQRMTASLMSMARAGLEGTAEGMRLSFAWQLLSRQIAAIFIPVVNLATNAIIYMRNVLMSFSGTMQNITLVVGGLIAAFVPFLASLPMIAALLQTVTALFSPFRLILLAVAGAVSAFLSSSQGAPVLAALGQAMSAVMGLFGTLAGLFGDVLAIPVQLLIGILTLLEPIITLVVKGLTLLANGLKWVFDKIRDFLAWLGFGTKELAKAQNAPRRDVTPAKFSFEGIGDAMERITLAANKTAAMDVATKQLTEQEKANRNLEGLRGDVQKLQPAVVR
jgi:hypothetical protein